MFRRVSDFQKIWVYESEATLKMLKGLSDASLSQSVGPDGRTLGRLVWHLTGTIPEMMNRTGLKVAGFGEHDALSASAAAIVAVYETASKSLVEEIGRWTDETLAVEDEMYGDSWSRGFTLTALVSHQTHHRGQMTVLMRQAGLKVSGVYGPAREEWGLMGAEPPAV